MKYLCSISFGLHDVILMDMNFTNGLKKRRKIIKSGFYSCQLMIMKDPSPSYQKHAMELNM